MDDQNRPTISRRDYLKRYLNSENEEKKLKKRKKLRTNIPKKKVSGMQIIDVDIDMKSIEVQGQNKEDSEDDEPPVIAEVIDERPKIMQIKEQYNSTKWKRLDNDMYDDANQGREAQQISQLLNVKSEHNASEKHSDMKLSSRTKQRRNDSDSDYSPPRRTPSAHDSAFVEDKVLGIAGEQVKRPTRRNTENSSDSDISLERLTSGKSHNSKKSGSSEETRDNLKHEHKSKTYAKHHKKKNRYDSDSDFSPPRKNDSDCNSRSPIRLGFTSLQKESIQKQSLSTKKKSQKDASLSYKDSDKVQKEKTEPVTEKVDQHCVEKIFLRGKQKEEEKKQRKMEEQRLAEKQAKYSKWGKGVEQKEEQAKRFEMDLHEMNKPFARYKDDDDLNQILKDREREGDPMLDYIRKKKKGNPSEDTPKYSGPPAPPNRFGILPGYRWDGVDRSNGFEKKYFSKINNTTSNEVESYLWSIQDM